MFSKQLKSFINITFLNSKDQLGRPDLKDHQEIMELVDLQVHKDQEEPQENPDQEVNYYIFIQWWYKKGGDIMHEKMHNKIQFHDE